MRDSGSGRRRWSIRAFFSGGGSGLRSQTIRRFTSDDEAGQTRVCGSDPAGAAPAADAAAPKSALAGRSVCVHVIQARALSAADSNGCSDPYCIVQVGDHKAVSHTELATLDPVWNEVMAFSPAHIAAALADGRPYVSLRVYDWDLVSADDFLGQCEVDLADIVSDAGGTQAPPEPRWVPLYGFTRSGRRLDAGHVQVAAWWEEAGSAATRAGHTTLGPLCRAPSSATHAPTVVHSQHGSLYEEPLVAGLALTLEWVQGMPVAAQGGSSSPGPNTPTAPSARRLSLSGGGLLGAFRRRRLTGGHAGPEPRDSALFHSEATLGLAEQSLLLQEEEDACSLPDLEEMMRLGGEDEEHGGTALQPYLQPSLSGASLDGFPPTRVGAGENGDAAAAVQQEEAGGADGDDGSQDGTSGHRVYVRAVLGRQQHTSYIRHERLDGTIHWHQTFVFAVPLPARNRQLRLELYRTPSCSQKGRLVSIAHVWLHDLLPPGLECRPAAVKHSAVPLAGALKHQPGGKVHLAATLVDTDLRREAYQAPFVAPEPRTAAPSTASGEAGAAGDAVEGAGADAAAVEGADAALLGGEAGDLVGSLPPSARASSQAPEGPSVGGLHLQRLDSATDEWNEREIRKKAQLTEESFEAWQDSKHHRAKQTAVGLVPAVTGLAHRLAWSSWRRVSSLAASMAEPTPSEESDAGGAGQAVPPRPPPQPFGSLAVTVDSLVISSHSSTDCFFVLKCGPYWARSSLLPCTGDGVAVCGWQMSLPILDPAALVTLAVFQQPARSHSASLAVLRQGLRVKDAVTHAFSAPVQLVGKLRVRLSCLRPNAPVSAQLPLLGERAKGAHAAGSARLTLLCSYEGASLLKGYASPQLPVAAYQHDVAGRAHQAALERERRRICLRWLEGANPSIPGPVAMAVLGTEREAFAMSRARVNWRRVQVALQRVRHWQHKVDAIKRWREPRESGAAMLGILLLCYLPRLAVPALLLCLVVAALMAQPPDFGLPAAMEEDPAGIDPENESLETTAANPVAKLRAQVDRLQRLGLVVQNLLDDVACALERAGALLTWQDPTATFVALVALVVVACAILLLGLPSVLAIALCFLIRPPALRTPTPPVVVAFFGRLPTWGDRIV